MRTKLIVIYLLFIFVGCDKQKHDLKKYKYQSEVKINNYVVKTNLNWLDENYKSGGIVLEMTNKKDSLLEIQKYIFYQEGDTIKLSSEFEDGVYTYLLKFNEDKQLVISPVFNNNEEGLFGYSFNELVLNKMKPVEK